jgi:hypothetical protein
MRQRYPELSWVRAIYFLTSQEAIGAIAFLLHLARILITDKGNVPREEHTITGGNNPAYYTTAPHPKGGFVVRA